MNPAPVNWKPPPGYLLTWTTYGTWLHGENPSSVVRSENQWGSPLVSPDPERARAERSRMSTVPLVLSPSMRSVASRAINDHCAFRGWELAALNVRTNHVHAVLVQPILPPEPIVKQLKEWATRRLRDARLVPATGRVWTAHASTRYLYETGSVGAAIEYVLHGQDRGVSGRPALDDV